MEELGHVLEDLEQNPDERARVCKKLNRIKLNRISHSDDTEQEMKEDDMISRMKAYKVTAA